MHIRTFCATMPPAGLEPTTLAHAAQTITQLANWDGGKRPQIFTDSKENGGPPDWLSRKNVLIPRRDSESRVKRQTPILRTQKRTAGRQIGCAGEMFYFPGTTQTKEYSPLSESCVKRTDPHFADSKEDGGKPDWLRRKYALIPPKRLRQRNISIV